MNDKCEFLCFRTGFDMQGQSKGYTALDESQLHCHTKDKARLQNVRTAQRKLVIASVICLLFTIAEFIGKNYFLENNCSQLLKQNCSERFCGVSWKSL